MASQKKEKFWPIFVKKGKRIWSSSYQSQYIQESKDIDFIGCPLSFQNLENYYDFGFLVVARLHFSSSYNKKSPQIPTGTEKRICVYREANSPKELTYCLGNMEE